MILKINYVKKGLKNKNFVENKNGKHIFYYLVNCEGRREVYTEISHGAKETNDSLIIAMAKELHLKNKKDFMDLLSCNKTYIELTKNHND